MKLRPAGALVLLFSLTASAEQRRPVANENVGFKIPVEFRPNCAYLARLPKAPARLTVKQFMACLTDDSRARLDRSYRKKVARLASPGAPVSPANLDALVAVHGGALVANAHLRDLAFAGAGRRRAIDRRVNGVPPASLTRVDRVAARGFGLDPATCDKSCLSVMVDVVDGQRTIGYRAASAGPGPSGSGRLLDEILPGTFPDHAQNSLTKPDLVQSGSGPVSAVNLFEWWNVPVFNGGSQLTSFDARAEYVADRMNTLDGANFTDDDDLVDFLEKYPKEMYDAGHIHSYPGSHVMKGDREAFKVLLSDIARGYPVVALYATGPTTLHWAMITGFQDGKLLIANANDRTLEDFYGRWNAWDSLSWYASYAAELLVDEDTFFAYTGWHDAGDLAPPRFAVRSSANPGYTGAGSTYRFRYCVGAHDDIGAAEAVHVSAWPQEPAGSLPGYCLYLGGTASFQISASSGGVVSASRGETIDVSVGKSADLTRFLTANPGAQCAYFGKATGTWTALRSTKCSDAGAFSYHYTNQGQYSELMFLIHAADLAHVTWTVRTP